MTIRNYIFIFLLSVCVSLSAQQVTFQKKFGGGINEWAECVQQTSDGGYIMAGVTNSFGAGNEDVYLLKTDDNADTVWTKTYGGTQRDHAYAVQQTIEGGYIVCGYRFNGTQGDDVYLIKADSNGDTLWTKTFGGTKDDYGRSVQQTSDGGYIIAGYTSSFGAGADDAYLIKTDSSGDTLWTKIFGGNGSDGGLSVKQTINSDYILTGYTNSFGAGNSDVYLIKTDTNGNPVWTKTFGGTGYDTGYSLQQTTGGGFVIIGTAGFGSGNFSALLITTDINGDTLWTKTYGGTNGYEYGYSVIQTYDGGFAFGGLTTSFGNGYGDGYLVKTNPNGNILWSKTYGKSTDDEWMSCIQQTVDEGYVLAGHSRPWSINNDNVYMVKTDSNGNSGCYETNANTLSTSPPTIIANPLFQISAGGFIGNPAAQVGSGGIVTTICSSTAVNEIASEKTISIYPNPCNGIFHIASDKTLIENIEVYNMLGEKIYSNFIKTFSNSAIAVNLSLELDGLYFVQVNSDKEALLNKLIIQK